MRLDMLAMDNVDLLTSRRQARQALSATVTLAQKSVWRLAHRGEHAARKRRARDRLVRSTENTIWAAETQFWARVGKPALDVVDRLAWHKSFCWGRESDESLSEAVVRLRREAGFIRAATELPRLRRLLSLGRWSNSGLTWQGAVHPEWLLRICSSPQRWERWLAKVRTRAAKLLRPWATWPSWWQLASLLGTVRWTLAPGARLPTVGKAVLALTGATLVSRFGAPPGLAGASMLRGVHQWTDYPKQTYAPWWRVLAAMRVFRSGGNPDRIVPPVWISQTELADFGQQSDDDRLSIASPCLVAWSKQGLLIADQNMNFFGSVRSGRVRTRARNAVVQVIVRNPADGKRCHLTVPPWFGLPLWEGESAEARIHAAVAWTFGLTPSEYRPEVES